MEDVKQPPQKSDQPPQQPPTDHRGGFVVYVVELVQKLPPTALVVLIVLGLYFMNREDSKEKDAKVVEAVTALNVTLEKQSERRAVEMEKAHQMFSSKQERQWEEVRKGNDIQAKVLSAVERLTDEVKRNKGAGGME